MRDKRIPCDDSVLEAILNASVQNEPSEDVLVHLESCSYCQKRLGELAAPHDHWQQAKKVIQSGAITENQQQIRFSAAEPQNLRWTEAMVRQLISPPAHPEMLGRLGRYEVERLVGSGGMGIVLKAFDTELNRPVAIKLLAPYLANSGAARKRFAREARAAAAVMNPHVVPIHNVETEGENPFIVMQYVSGTSLQNRLDSTGPLTLPEILRIGMQVADGLAAAHEQGLIHRDIKPSNILLEESVDRALISDFGLARAVDDASLTLSGSHPGTPQYMSPEQASGQPIDHRSDLFSLGSTLYAMCTGHSPFRAESTLAVMRRIAESAPTPIREINPEIPDWFCAIVDALLSKQKENRPATALNLRTLLSHCLNHVQQPLKCPLPHIPQPTSVTPHNQAQNTRPNRRLRKLILASASLTIALMVAGWIAKLSPKDSPQPAPPKKLATAGGVTLESHLSDEEKRKINTLLKHSPLVVTGTIGPGVPTATNYAYIFELSETIKGKALDLTVILSNAIIPAADDPLAQQAPETPLPKIPPGEYVIALQPREVPNRARPIISFLPGTSQSPTFNYFISTDDEKHAAWPIDSQEAQYIQSLYAAASPNQPSDLDSGNASDEP